MAAGITSALIGAITAVMGWFITEYFVRRRSNESMRQEAALQHLKYQIEELYGPLIGLIQRSSTVYQVAMRLLPPASDGQRDVTSLRGDAKKIWYFFVEEYFLPSNSEIRNLVLSRMHLFEGGTIPASIQQFFEHATQFECLHRLWREKNVTIPGMHGAEWPPDLEADIDGTLRKLQLRYQEYRQQAEGRLGRVNSPSAA
ncbi:MAG TPA: hypothetical protein VGB92_08595 [Longimicrobium sp.]|jgi:hypothetical protein